MTVNHDQDNKNFYIQVGLERAELSYRFSDDGVFDLYRTHVPEEGRGQGLAKMLVDAAIVYIRGQNGRVRPSCSYVEKYFEKHPELKDLRSGPL